VVEGVDEAKIVRGDVLSRAFLAGIVGGHSAVISCLGLRRANPLNPWSVLRSPPDLTQRVAGHLVAVMPTSGVRKLVVVSTAGVGDSFDNTNSVVRHLINRSNLWAAYSDLDAMEHLLRESSLDWVAVRPTTLIRGGPTGRVQVVDRYRLSSRITRGDVASWMLDAVASEAVCEDRTPMITAARWTHARAARASPGAAAEHRA
jgi:putative NADH-flavin reductase